MNTTQPNKRIMPTRALSSMFHSKKLGKILALVSILIIFLVPIYRLVLLSFQQDGNFSLANYTNLLKDPKTWDVLYNTVIMVLGSTLIAVTLGVTLAFLVAYTDIRAKKLMQIFIVLPFIIPSYISTLAWTQFLGANGLYGKMVSALPFSLEPINLYSRAGIIFVLGFSHYPLVYLLSVGVLRKIPRELEQASRVSGASAFNTFKKVTLPLALPGIASGGFLAFLANLDNFGIPAFLGIPAQISVLSTYIYQQVVGFGPTAFERAATLSVLLGVVALLGIFIQWLLLKKSKRIETTVEDKKPRFSLGKKRIWIEVFLWSFFLLSSVVPFVSMGMTSLVSAYGLDFTLENITLKNYQYIFETSAKSERAIFNSLKLAGITTLIGIVLGTAFAYYRVRRPNKTNQFQELAISMPYALPGTVMALSMIFAWMEPIPGFNPGIYGSILILFIAYFTRFFILQVRGSITAAGGYHNGRSCTGKWVQWRNGVRLPLLY